MLTRLPDGRRFACLLLALLFVSSGHAAQRPVSSSNGRVTVQAKRIELLRTGQLAKPFPWKRRVTLTYPVVTGLNNPRVLARVRSTLDIKNVFGSSPAEYRDDGWLTDFSYKVNYNRNYILDITFEQSGVGAYPDTQTKHFAINLRNGSTMKALDAFLANKLQALAELVRAKFQNELKQILKDLAESRSDPEDIRIGQEAQEALEFKIEDLNEFSVGGRGLTFLYDAGYPHVIQAFEHEGKYFFSYEEDVPLGQFID